MFNIQSQPLHLDLIGKYAEVKERHDKAKHVEEDKNTCGTLFIKQPCRSETFMKTTLDFVAALRRVHVKEKQAHQM